MDILKPKKLEDYIIKLLMNGEDRTVNLIEKLRSELGNITKQGFYASLRKLKTNETILIYKSKVSLNTVWIKKMRDIFEHASRTYTIDQDDFDVLDLEDRESISYTFSNVRNLDVFWGHSQNILLHNTSINEPIYCYDPHYWFYIARKETESELLNEITRNKRQFLMSVGYTTLLDRSIKTDFNNDFIQYNYKKMFDGDNYYITVVGDYITEVYLDSNISREIHKLYENTNILNEKVINLFKTYLESKTKNRIKISKNKDRARKLKIRMGKDFYIMKQ